MSKYTTGELAKLCGVTVRTVQYYDTRGILSPGELTEGGRRLYSEDELRKMKAICFLREVGLSIDTIGKLLKEDNSETVILLLLEQREKELKDEIESGSEKLEKLAQLKKEIRTKPGFSVESISDMADIMKNSNKLKKFRLTAGLSAAVVGIIEIAMILLWALKGLWIPFVAVYAAIVIPYGIIFSWYYYKHVAYICPECHEVFSPRFKEMFFASHTMKTRKLTCPKCGKKSFCVEVWKDE